MQKTITLTLLSACILAHTTQAMERTIQGMEPRDKRSHVEEERPLKSAKIDEDTHFFLNYYKRSLDQGQSVHDFDLCARARDGQEEAVRFLLDRGANVNQAHEQYTRELDHKNTHNTPLICALLKGHLQVARLLLERGADADRTNKEGKTALMYGAENGDLSAIQLLTNYRARINYSNQNGLTALECAAAQGHEPAVQLLLNEGASVYQAPQYEMMQSLRSSHKPCCADLMKLFAAMTRLTIWCDNPKTEIIIGNNSFTGPELCQPESEGAQFNLPPFDTIGIRFPGLATLFTIDRNGLRLGRNLNIKVAKTYLPYIEFRTDRDKVTFNLIGNELHGPSFDFAVRGRVDARETLKEGLARLMA